ncbi:MAG: polyphosphate polymerase domain-containing protein [Myxococcota bacterium]
METQFRRREWKFLVGQAQASALEAELCRHMVKDPHGDPMGRYQVTSRYFDTPDLAIYRDRVLSPDTDGPTKLRMRVYGAHFYPEMPAMVELKHTHQGVSHKQRLAITLAEAVDLLRGAGPPRRCDDQLLAARVHRLVRTDRLVAVCDVAYTRTAFYAPEVGLRVTLDRQLVGRKLRTEPPVSSPLLAADAVVVELKAERRLPAWTSEILSGLYPLEQRFSKYVTAMGGIEGLDYELAEVTIS